MSFKRNKGMIKTAHGEIQMPFFMPDATRGYVKSVSMEDLERVGVGPMVVNTLHLYLEPGISKLKVRGCIHSFMNWQHPLLSDSGGFQVFSLIHKNPKMGKIFDDKVVFKSPLDGSKHELTPEKSIQIQFDLGVDMMVCLDDCPPNSYNEQEIGNSVSRTIAWAKRCRREYEKQIKKRKLKEKTRPLLFSVVQGGQYEELRKYCAQELVKIGFDGYGFGGSPLSQDGEWMDDIAKYIPSILPKDSLRFALGIGTPEDILRCAAYGWDMFDCVIPTREARHGRLFLWNKNFKFQILNFKTNSKYKISKSKSQPRFYETININNAKFAEDFSPINEKSKLSELRKHTKAYLRHLFKMKEPMGARLASLNNLEFYMELMERIRLDN